MVCTGRLSPDPSNRPEESNLSLETPNLFMPMVQNSDSDDEDMAHDGYEMLPQDLNDAVYQEADDSDDDSSSVENGDIPQSNIPPVSTFDQAFSSEITALWSTTHAARETNIEMDSDKEEQVRNAMANFSLPSSAIPSWAKHIPEEEWKQQLLQQINLKK